MANQIVSLHEMAEQIGKDIEAKTGCKTFGEFSEWVKKRNDAEALIRASLPWTFKECGGTRSRDEVFDVNGVCIANDDGYDGKQFDSDQMRFIVEAVNAYGKDA